MDVIGRQQLSIEMDEILSMSNIDMLKSPDEVNMDIAAGMRRRRNV